MIASPREHDGGPIDCTMVQLALQDRFDGEPEAIPAIDGRRVDAHADACPDCSAFRCELERSRRALQGLAGLEFPEPALREVWARTIDSAEAARPRRLRIVPALAAAAALLLTSAGAFFGADGRFDQGAMNEAELARLDRDVHRALLIVREVLSGAEHLAVDQVLVGEAARVIRVVTPSRNEDARAIQ